MTTKVVPGSKLIQEAVQLGSITAGSTGDFPIDFRTAGFPELLELGFQCLSLC